MEIRILPVKDEDLLRKIGIPWTTRYLRKLHSQGLYPQLFTRIGGRLFVVVAEWEKMVDEALLETQARAKRLKVIGLID